ncbi:hypothetical protein ABIQ69_08740 [Agromyces sp. G08B096]|uniref:Protein kinase domain-containing protein n=1 Tax=Agromyces sp. G08B096 TaxID=3156399 RepID=A0AAU7W2N7_9MICO
MRRRSTSAAPAPEPSSPAEPPETGWLAGYRLLRRIAAGRRAHLYLAVAGERAAVPGEARIPARPSGDDHAPAEVVVVRVYEPEADPAPIAIELDAMSHVNVLPRLRDLATLPDGRTCLVVERLGATSLASIGAHRSITVGEAITVLAPVVVGVGELERHGFALTRMTPADVLFDGRGRPRLVGTGWLTRLPAPGVAESERTALVRATHAAYAGLVDDVAGMTHPAGALEPIRALLAERLAERPFVPCHGEVERLLFAIGAPAPVAGLTLAPARHPSPVLEGPRGMPGTPPDLAPVGADEVERASRGGLAGALRAAAERLGMGELAAVGVSRATGRGRSADGPRRRILEMLARRRATVTVAALAGGGALILLLTLVPPSDAGPDASAATSGSVPGTGVLTTQPATTGADVDAAQDAPGSASDGSASNPPASETGASTSASDAASAVAELLVRRDTCFDRLDLACLDGVVQAGSALEAADRTAILDGQSGAAPGGREAYDLAAPSILGEMGEAWLVGVPYADAQREPASVLVMRTEAGWRLREIFD